MGILRRSVARILKALSDPVLDRGGWLPVIRESYAGAWQQNVEINFNSVLSNWAVFACASLLASDFAKVRVKLVERESFDGIWKETTSAAFSPVLRKPNGFQNRIQFFENWALSKLLKGNTYALKQRDGRGVVVRLYILDPDRVRPMISDFDGSIFYELNTDNISNIKERVLVPAREIIHDRFNCLFHPLVGTSPIFAAGLAATQALNIQKDSTLFFANQSLPGVTITAPGHIADDVAARIKTTFDTNFGGLNRGKTAVLGDGLSITKLSMTADESQLIEQLKFTAEMVCSVFHVPPYKIGVGALPSYNNVQALNVEYLSQGLQRLFEDAEICLDEGLGTGENLGTEFDTENLLRMDSSTQIDVASKATGAGIWSPDEARKKFDLSPVAGGSSPYLQQQNYSLAALAKRDAMADPFATAPAPGSSSPPLPAPDDQDEDPDGETRTARRLEFKRLLIEGVAQ